MLLKKLSVVLVPWGYFTATAAAFTTADDRLSPRIHSLVAAAETKDDECASSIPPPPDLTKYPRTAHLIDMGASAVDDIVVSDRGALSRVLRNSHQQNLVVEEKLDGANMGISYAEGTFWVQNRGHYIDYSNTMACTPQFYGLSTWLQAHEVELYELLGDGNAILYGEWLMARHSIPYGKLPGYFLAFDLFDKTAQRFLSRRFFHVQLQRVQSIPAVPVLWCSSSNGRDLSKSDVLQLLDSPSAFRTDGGTVEGIVLRVDDNDAEGYLQERFKIVRGDFAACISDDGHWSKRKLDRNRVDFAFADEYRKTCFASLVKSSRSVATMSLQERNKRQRNAPRCIILMGLPGSGKSTFARRLSSSTANKSGDSKTWIVVNQDTLGRKQALQLASKASRRNRMLIDRCHATEQERLRWWQAMGSPPKRHVALVYFCATADECAERVMGRTDHPTIPNNARGAAIVRSILLEPPTRAERQIFGTIEAVATLAEATELLQKWGADV